MEAPRDQVWRVASAVSVSAGDRMVVLSEFARRHPQWTILELHPGDGLYDLRALGESRGDKWSSLFPTTSMGRHTSIMILIGREVFWEDARVQSDPHAMVRSFERRLNAPRPNPVPPTVAKTRAYRVLGWIAAAGINLKLPIDIRSGFSDSSGMDGSENRPIMEWFPQAESRTPP